ncbi:MAG: putative baseplate assembly protein [Terracidiphilus sp.]
MGISVVTPVAELNAPGLPAIAYRTGVWATFLESMKARLSSSDYPALTGLKTRSSDDFSIALLDASAVVLDILTFYQERLANESYLGTATQLYSLTQLSRLIGYQPWPGVSASVYLAFSLASAPGLPPNPGTTAITIPTGTTVQSVPTQGQTAQLFQTSAPILAKPDWNALDVQTGIPWVPQPGDKSVFLAGMSTSLNPGDAILIVGDERLNDNTSSRWDIRIVTTVTPDTVNGRTLVQWKEGLGGEGVSPAQENPQVYALRQKASLYGYNAINPSMLDSKVRAHLKSEGLIADGFFGHADWIFGYDSVNDAEFWKESLVDLDQVYSKIVPDGWLVLINPDQYTNRTPAGYITLYLVNGVTSITRSDFGMSGKVTRLSVDENTYLGAYYDMLRVTSALTQSELLPVAEQPLDYPLYGTVIDLENERDDLSAITAVAVTGSNPLLVVKNKRTVDFTPYDGPDTVTYQAGSVFTLMQPPTTTFNTDGSIPDWRTIADAVEMVVMDPTGRLGTVKAKLHHFTLTPAPPKSPVVQEVAQVASVALLPASQSGTNITPARTRIVVMSPLLNCYDRTTTTINANVGTATGGGPVTELLGSGAAATDNQAFTLKQTPLTYTQAVTPTGAASSLSVSVNGAAWQLVPTLYQQPPQAQVFTSVTQSNGSTQVIFGDNVEGSTVPTGQNNIVATYRTGLGVAGNVATGAISTLVDRPVGVSGVVNPMPATGGQDPATVADIQSAAPMSVQTLGRAVSVTDYQNFAATFAGIAKASAVWLPSGFYRGVFLTVAAAGGAELPPGNLTLANLVASLKAYGNPAVPFKVGTFLETIFGFEADLAINPAYSTDAVQAAAMALLNSTYSFANRTFGQGVSADELDAVIQSVPGVVAVNIKHLKTIATSQAGDLGSAGFSVAAYQSWIQQYVHVKRPRSGAHNSICPYIPVPHKNKLPEAAEILVISPNPNDIVLGVMQ